MRIGQSRRNRIFARLFALGAGALIAVTLAPRSATADQEAVLYSFCAQANCIDGSFPRADLIMDPAGNLYGTTQSGGAHKAFICYIGYGGCGTVFELTPNADKTAWTQKVLYSFCAQYNGTYCTDGAVPGAGLIMDKTGNLYGTTAEGGSYGGVVFELTPNATRTAWTQKVLYRFCAQTDCTDGAYPVAVLIMDAAGNLYGTTGGGGANCQISGGCGTVFELKPPATGKTAWTHKVLYSFCAQGGTACTDGEYPGAGLIMDKTGNLYGTTEQGGIRSIYVCGNLNESHTCGTVFELTPPAVGKTAWTETVLYRFCAQTNCTDGALTDAGVIMDAAGNLYGTTEYGGMYDGNGRGIVFELTPNAAKTGWTETVLHSFYGYPVAGVIMDVAGNLYGTTSGGWGTAFELTPNAARTAWTRKLLYSFCAQGGTACTDGREPEAGLIMDISGNLYGTTYFGGANCQSGHPPGCGTVFELKP
jgi:uncharacterized repeat protein (TIGR03803 family)